MAWVKKKFLKITLDKSHFITGGSETSPETKFYDIEFESGTYYLKINRSAYATGKYTVSYNLKKIDISNADIRVIPQIYTYSGKSKEPSVIVKVENKELKKDIDYTVSYKNNINVGSAVISIKAKEGSNYTGSKNSIFTIKKASQALKLNVSKKNYKAKDLKVRNKRFSIKVSKSKTPVTYKVTKGFPKYITVSKKGIVTVKRGAKKGIYKVTPLYNFSVHKKCHTGLSDV